MKSNSGTVSMGMLKRADNLCFEICFKTQNVSIMSGAIYEDQISAQAIGVPVSPPLVATIFVIIFPFFPVWFVFRSWSDPQL